LIQETKMDNVKLKIYEIDNHDEDITFPSY